MSKQLLVDYIPFEVTPQQINESLAKNGKLIVSGVLQRAEAKNQNGRIYPRETLVREAKKYAQVQIAERRALGELDHPDSSVVNLNNVSHNVVKVQPDFELIAFDFVSNPSTHGAFMSPGQLKESIDKGLGTRDGKCCHDCKVENIINDIFRGE